MSKVLKWNEPSFAQEALTKGRVCHELCCVPRGRRLTSSKALPSRLRLDKGSSDLSRCRRCHLREMKTSGRWGGWRWWPRWQVWVWRRTECGKGIVGRKVCLDPSVGLAMHGQCEGKGSLEDYLGSNLGGLCMSPWKHWNIILLEIEDIKNTK